MCPKYCTILICGPPFILISAGLVCTRLVWHAVWQVWWAASCLPPPDNKSGAAVSADTLQVCQPFPAVTFSPLSHMLACHCILVCMVFHDILILKWPSFLSIVTALLTLSNIMNIYFTSPKTLLYCFDTCLKKLYSAD